MDSDPNKAFGDILTEYKPLTLPAGIHDISAEHYHGDPAPAPSLSSSIAKLIISRSALHAWTAHPKLNPNWEPKESKTFDIGRAAHRAVLGKGGDYVAIPEGILASNGAASTKEAKAFIEQAREAGLTPLKEAEVAQIEAMAAVVRRALDDMGILLDPVRSEMTALAEVQGVWCRAMVDNAPSNPRMPLIDFKTCEDASPQSCRRSVENYGYDVQMAHYLETWEAACGEKRDFLFIFQEKTAPYEIGVMRLLAKPGHSEDWLEDAQEKIRHARGTWAECLRTDIWPGYPRLIMEVGANPYFRQRWQDTAVRNELLKPKPTQQAKDRAAEWQRPLAS